MTHAQKINPNNYQTKDTPSYYTNCNGNEVKLTGELETPTKYEGKTTKTIQKVIEGAKEPKIGMDNILKLWIQRIAGGELLGINRFYENNTELVKKLLCKYEKLFNENHTVKISNGCQNFNWQYYKKNKRTKNKKTQQKNQEKTTHIVFCIAFSWFFWPAGALGLACLPLRPHSQLRQVQQGCGDRICPGLPPKRA